MHILFLSQESLYHIRLPWNSTSLTVTPVFEEVPLAFPLSVNHVGPSDIDGVLQIALCSPLSSNHLMIGVFMIHANVLLTWISRAHQIVQTHARGNDEPNCWWNMVHGGEEYLEPIGKDAKSILDHTTCSWQSIIENPLVVVLSTVRVRLHHSRPQSECVVTDDVVRHILVVIGEGFSWRESDGVIIDAVFQLRPIVDLRIGCCSFPWKTPIT